MIRTEAPRMQMMLAFHFEEVRIERIHAIGGQVVIIAGR